VSHRPRGVVNASERMRRGRRMVEEQRKVRLEALEEHLRAGGDPDVPKAELIPTEEDRVRLEREIRTIANQAANQPKTSKRRKKLLDRAIPLVAELCVVERVLALDPLERAGLRPSQLASMAHTSPTEMHGKLAELVAGVVGGGSAPKIEVPGA
jgi:hypothetical protein